MNSILTDQMLRQLLERRAAAGRPDGLLAEIVLAIETTPQRRNLTQRVLPPLTRHPSLALVPLVAIVAIVGLLVLAPRFDGPAVQPTPLPSLTPALSPSPTLPALRAGGLESAAMPAGRYVSSRFQPTLSVTLPDRLWAAVIDAERQILLRARLPGVRASENDSMTLVTITNIYEDACTQGTINRSVPWTSTPTAFLDWLETEMTVDFGPRTTRTILGRPAIEVDFIAPDLAHCRGGFLAITDAGPVNPFGSSPAGQPTRYAVFELDGQTVLVSTWTTDPARRDAVWAAADAVLESLVLVP